VEEEEGGEGEKEAPGHAEAHALAGAWLGLTGGEGVSEHNALRKLRLNKGLDVLVLVDCLDDKAAEDALLEALSTSADAGDDGESDEEAAKEEEEGGELRAGARSEATSRMALVIVQCGIRRFSRQISPPRVPPRVQSLHQEPA